MAQTKMGSFAEAWANIGVGFAINWTANMVILPWFGFNIHAGAAFEMGLIFTLISLARSYVLRRWFNGLKFGNTASAQRYTIKINDVGWQMASVWRSALIAANKGNHRLSHKLKRARARLAIMEKLYGKVEVGSEATRTIFSGGRTLPGAGHGGAVQHGEGGVSSVSIGSLAGMPAGADVRSGEVRTGQLSQRDEVDPLLQLPDEASRSVAARGDHRP